MSSERSKRFPEPKEKSCMMKIASCFSPLFKDKVITTSNRCTYYCNLVVGTDNVKSASLVRHRNPDQSHVQWKQGA